MKKLLFLKLLVLVACLSSALGANAGYFYYNGLRYVTYSDNTAAVIIPAEDDYYSGDITIPSTVPYNGTYYTVTEIFNNAFQANLYGTHYITSISIPNTVTKIGQLAFDGQKYLTSVTLPSNLQSIGGGAFDGCSSLTSITIPNTVTILGQWAFANCTSLASVSIGSNVTEISVGTFENTALTEVVIPDNVTTIESRAFQGCTNMTKMTVGKSVTEIDDEAFDFQGTYTVNGSTILRQVEFHMKSINPPTITSTTFGESNSVNNLNPYYRHQIYTVNPYSRSLYKAATYWSNFRCLYNSAYDNLVDQKYDFYTGGIYYLITGTNTVKVTNKNGGTLSNDNVTSYTGDITIPLTAKYSDLNKTYNVTAIGTHAFDETRLMNLNNPGEAPSLRGTQGDLKSVIVGNNVTTIEDYAFTNATGLTSVTLGTGVTSIGSYAFNGCTSLYTVNSNRTTPPTIQSTTFDNSHYSSTKVYVPKSAINSYKNKAYWKNFYMILPNDGTDLDYALNVEGGNIHFTTVNYPWLVWGDGTRVYARSYSAGTSFNSDLIAVVSVTTESIVTFDYYTIYRTPGYVDPCVFSIDGEAKLSTIALPMDDWSTVSYELPAGTHTLKWSYTSQANSYYICNDFFVDNVAITAQASSVGDVNGDNQVTIADVTALIDILLAGTTPPAGADVNGDNQVTIADVTALIDYLLSGSW